MTRNLVATAGMFVCGLTLLAGCGGASTGVLTGRITFSGNVPPTSLLAEDEVVASHNGVVAAHQALHMGTPYRFSLTPGDYTISLRGPSSTTWGNMGRVYAGRTTQMDLTDVFHGQVSGSPVLLAGNGVGTVRFGEPESSAIADLGRLLGSPTHGPIDESGNCTIDAAEQWRTLTAYFQGGFFVGFSTLAVNAESLPQADTQTAQGLRVGDTVARARAIYGAAFQTSFAQGGSWSVTTAAGTLIGYLSAEPNQAGPSPAIASIEAGSVGCPAATP
ncbi:MAG TPA: hypothetical protein VLZ77_16785 [Acidimicrobiales bacterium]|nr:hypothetical protein [Acidimicrobiales bacterium]